MNISERIKTLRKSQNLTQKQLAEKLGVTDVAIRYWESGARNPSGGAIKALAQVFGVTTDYLLDTKEENRIETTLSHKEKDLIDRYRTLDQPGQMAVDIISIIEAGRIRDEKESNQKHDRFIPSYDSPAAAGIAAPLDGVDFQMKLVDDSVPYNADFAVRIQGNSMSPYINDGDIVFCKKDCDLQNGDVGIFCVNGATYCKQFYRDIKGNVTLVSANPDLSDANVYISAESNSSFVCNGQVILDRKISFPDYFLGNND